MLYDADEHGREDGAAGGDGTEADADAPGAPAAAPAAAAGAPPDWAAQHAAAVAGGACDCLATALNGRSPCAGCGHLFFGGARTCIFCGRTRMKKRKRGA